MTTELRILRDLVMDFIRRAQTATDLDEAAHVADMTEQEIRMLLGMGAVPVIDSESIFSIDPVDF